MNDGAVTLHRHAGRGSSFVRWNPSQARGSVLVVVLLFGAISTLLLGSYLSLGLGTARLTQRTFNKGAAFHLAEAGLEEGLWAYNQRLAGNEDVWGEWELSGNAAWRRFKGFSLAAGTVGTIKVYASPATPGEQDSPTLVSLASVQTNGGAQSTQMIETRLRRRSFFGNGVVARERLDFRGRVATFDSWDSDPDHDPTTPAEPYTLANSEDTGSIATEAEDNAYIILNQARIHGYFYTAGTVPEVGADGFIGAFGVEPGVADPARISTHFHANFPTVPAPSGGVHLTSVGSTLGTTGEKTFWRMRTLRLAGRAALTILGEVTLVLTDPDTALTITGNAGLIIPTGSSLRLYVQGDVSIVGNSITNNNASPASFQLWSAASAESMRRIVVTGNGHLSALVYAPNADVTLNGHATVNGSIIARRLVFAGNVAFHYDLALARFGGHGPYRAERWRTVDSTAERATLLPLVDR